MCRKTVSLLLLLCFLVSIPVMATPVQNTESTSLQTRMPQGERPEGMMPENFPDANGAFRRPDFQGGQMPSDGMRPQSATPHEPVTNAESTTETQAGFLGFLYTYQTPVTAVLLLIAAFVFVSLYKRKRY